VKGTRTRDTNYPRSSSWVARIQHHPRKSAALTILRDEFGRQVKIVGAPTVGMRSRQSSNIGRFNVVAFFDTVLVWSTELVPLLDHRDFRFVVKRALHVVHQSSSIVAEVSIPIGVGSVILIACRRNSKSHVLICYLRETVKSEPRQPRDRIGVVDCLEHHLTSHKILDVPLAQEEGGSRSRRVR